MAVSSGLSEGPSPGGLGGRSDLLSVTPGGHLCRSRGFPEVVISLAGDGIFGSPEKFRWREFGLTAVFVLAFSDSPPQRLTDAKGPMVCSADNIRERGAVGTGRELVAQMEAYVVEAVGGGKLHEVETGCFAAAAFVRDKLRPGATIYLYRGHKRGGCECQKRMAQ
jgi:hypothetical protein